MIEPDLPLARIALDAGPLIIGYVGTKQQLKGYSSSSDSLCRRVVTAPRIMHLIAGVRGATSGLMAEVVEHHVRTHLSDRGRKSRADEGAAEELIDVVRTYHR